MQGKHNQSIEISVNRTRCYLCRSTGRRCKDVPLGPFGSCASSPWWTLRSLSFHSHQHRPVSGEGNRSLDVKMRISVDGDGLLSIRLDYRHRTKISVLLTASINCFTSYSESLVPCWERPCLSSSRVIVPLLSASIPLNISFKPRISSSDRHPAITFKSTEHLTY